jgi:5-(carboxyamino)imidazole ribonucleotide mutase
MGKAMNGLDSLLSIVQMPPGVPVATVSVDGAKNAALLAIQILAVSNSDIYKKMQNYKVQMGKEILRKDKNLKKNN